MPGSVDVARHEAEDDPGTVEEHAGDHDDLAGDGPHRGPSPELADVGQRIRMDHELAEIRERLDGQNPAVSAAQTAAHRTGQADVVARLAVIVGEDVVPAVQGHAFAAQHRRVEVRLQPAAAGAPDVEVAVAS